VGDEDDGEAEPGPEPVDLGEDVALHDDVERGGRFVQDDHVGAQRHRHGDHHALAHPAGELVRVRRESFRADPDQFQQFAAAPLARAAIQLRPVRGEHVGELLAYRQHRVERVHRALEHHRDPLPAERAQRLAVQGGQVDRGAVLGVEEHLAADESPGWCE
jgi:hypothetical protein